MLISQNIVVERIMLSERPKVFEPRYREGLLSAVSAGFFFILIGGIFVATPNLFDNIFRFFNDFDMVNVPNTVIYLPAPKYPPTSPTANSAVYSATWQFSLVWSFFQIVFVMLRFIAGSPWGKKAETASNVVFWFGTSYLIRTLLNETATTTTWFVFWAEVIMLIGVSLIVRAFILAVRR